MLKPTTITIGLLFTTLIGCSSGQKDEMTIDETLSSETSYEQSTMELPKKVAVINFDFDSSTISTHEAHHLNETLSAMNRAPEGFAILIKGHTDKIGPADYNQKLGLKRAKSVRDALIARGVQDVRIETISYGEEKPAIMASSWDERSKNRRAIIEIVPVSGDSPNTTVSMNQ